MAEIEKDNSGERLIPTSFSAALLAETGGIDLETAYVLLVRDRETKKWGLPAGHSLVLPDGRLELPQETIIREWNEETGNLPMDFRYPPHLENPVLIHSPGEKARMGFVFSTSLNYGFVERFFHRNPNQILRYMPRRIKQSYGFETDMVGLFNCNQLMKMLKSWEDKLYKPQINADTLLDWCNYLVSSYTSLYFGGSNWETTREELGFTWQQIKVW